MTTRRDWSLVPERLPAKVPGMARPPGTPQPRAQEPVAHSGGRVKLYAYVPRSHYEKLRTAAYASGMSLGAYLTYLIDVHQVDDQDRPLAEPVAQSADKLPLAV